MLGPRPSSAAAPSIWYAAVLVPKRKPGGSWGSTGTIMPVTVEIRRASAAIRHPRAGSADPALLLVRRRTTTRRTSASARWSATTTTCSAAGRASPTTRTATWRSSPGCSRGALVHTDSPAPRPRSRPGTGPGAVRRVGDRAQRDRRPGGRADPVRPGLADARTTAAPAARRRRTRPRRCDFAGGGLVPVASGHDPAAAVRLGRRARPSRWPGSPPARRSRCPTTRSSTCTCDAGRCARSSLAEPLADGDAFRITDQPRPRGDRRRPHRAAASGPSPLSRVGADGPPRPAESAQMGRVRGPSAPTRRGR